MITVFRPYFTIAREFNPFFEGSFAYAPSFFIFKKSGYTSAGGSAANPWFEHLLILNAGIKPVKSLSIGIPAVLQMTKYRNFADGATMNDRWSYNLWTWPEIDWDINAQHTVGVAYQSDNFLKANGTGTRGKTAYTLGVAQVLWNYKF